MRHLPRLPAVNVDQIYDRIHAAGDVEEVRTEEAASRHPMMEWNATGNRVDENWLRALADTIRDIAGTAGYPTTESRNYRKFDFDVSILLQDRFQNIHVGELLRSDVWAFLASVLLPDVTLWRFPNLPKERLSGGIRNTFQRLWLRGFLLDRGDSSDNRWLFLEKLTEDAMVQITERPGISSNARFARAFAESWVRTEATVRLPMEKITREAAKYATAKNIAIMLDALADDPLQEMVDDLFSLAVRAVESD